MGKIKVRFKKGFSELVKNTFELRAKEITDIMATEIEKEVKMRFVNEIDPRGKKWKRTNRKGKILRDTGDLMGSIHQVSDGKRGGVATNKKYARIHNYGGTILPKNKTKLRFKGADSKYVFADKVEIPKRQFFGMNRKLKNRIRKKISKKILESIKNS